MVAPLYPSGVHGALDHADMEKAVRWAVHSAKQAAEQPTCTVFVLPGWQEYQHTAYFKWLEAEPSYCFKIATIKNNNNKNNTKTCALAVARAAMGPRTGTSAGGSCAMGGIQAVHPCPHELG